MKIFGINFTTKKELKKQVADLMHELDSKIEVFPFTLGQTVYDVQLRNEMGRYARKNASLEHSLINEVVVTEKNYFNLVERFNKQDVFTSRELAKIHLETICKK